MASPGFLTYPTTGRAPENQVFLTQRPSHGWNFSDKSLLGQRKTSTDFPWGFLMAIFLKEPTLNQAKRVPMFGKSFRPKKFTNQQKKQADILFPSNKKPPRSLRILGIRWLWCGLLKMDATIKSPKHIIRIPPKKSKHGTCQQAFPKIIVLS